MSVYGETEESSKPNETHKLMKADETYLAPIAKVVNATDLLTAFD